MAAADRDRLIVTTPSDREIALTRVFDAPRRLVFDAWTRPELLARWYGARGWTVPVCEIDLRPGGAYRYVMRGPGGAEMAVRGEYREVVPPDRLVYTEVYEGSPEVGWRPEDATVVTAVFAERNGKTTWTATILYPSKEARDAVLQSGMARGAGESLDRLAELLRPATGRPIGEHLAV
jgi:uncharacterized protein YndB with AHSA1/START domain